MRLGASAPDRRTEDDVSQTDELLERVLESIDSLRPGETEDERHWRGAGATRR
jgi:hypothetical protein